MQGSGPAIRSFILGFVKTEKMLFLPYRLEVGYGQRPINANRGCSR
jgi:hypothetical protein